MPAEANPDVRRPRVGDAVLYRGRPATVTAVLPEGASWMPAGRILPIDLVWDNPWGLIEGSSMVGYGPTSGWSWPDPQPNPTEVPRDEA